MSKFNPCDWSRIDGKDNKFIAPQGKLWLRASAPINVYVTDENGFEALAGYGQEIDITTTQEVSVEYDAPTGTRVYLFWPHLDPIHCCGEIFTNMDRSAHQSGTLLAVTGEARLLELQQRQFRAAQQEQMVEMQNMIAAQHALNAELKAAREAQPPLPDPSQEPAA